MRIKALITTILISFFCTANSLAQTVSGVEFTFDGINVNIRYNLELSSSYYMEDAKLLVSIDGADFVVAQGATGDLGDIYTSGYKKILWNPESQFGLGIIDKTISFCVEGTQRYYSKEGGDQVKPTGIGYRKKTNFWLEYLFSPTAPMGFGMGVVGKWGGYMRYQFSLTDTEGVYNNIENHSETDLTMSFAEDNGYKRKNFTCGVVYKTVNWLYLYTGIGYGEFANLVSVESNKYGYSNVDTYLANEMKGVALEVGGIVRMRNFGISGGWTALLPTVKTGNAKFLSEYHVGVMYFF